jgi:hypothetical protein
MALVFAYLRGVCFPKEEDANGNLRPLGFVAQNRSVIHRAEGVPLGIEGNRMCVTNFVLIAASGEINEILGCLDKSQ